VHGVVPAILHTARHAMLTLKSKSSTPESRGGEGIGARYWVLGARLSLGRAGQCLFGRSSEAVLSM